MRSSPSKRRWWWTCSPESPSRGCRWAMWCGVCVRRQCRRPRAKRTGSAPPFAASSGSQPTRARPSMAKAAWCRGKISSGPNAALRPCRAATRWRKPPRRTNKKTSACLALISVELFQGAAAKLAENRQRYREQKKGAEFLLSGLLVCRACASAYCGRRHRAGRREYVYYRCLGTDKYRHGDALLCTNPSVNGRVEEAVWADACAERSPALAARIRAATG
jgi:hypothetical protein